MKYLPGFVLLLASWLQPLHLLPWTSWHSEVLAFAAIAWFLSVELLAWKKSGQGFVDCPRIAMTPIVLGLLALLQFGLGQISFFGDALVIFFYMAVASIVIAIGHAWALRHQPSQNSSNVLSLPDQLAMTVLTGAVLSVLIALVQAFNVWDWADWIVRLSGFRRPGANIGQANHFASLVLMGIASLVYRFEAKRISLKFAIVLLLILTLGLAMSESRTGLLSAFALTAWGIYRRRLFLSSGFKPLVVTGWINLLFFVWAWPLFLTFFHIAGGSARIDVSAGARLVVWPQLMEAVMQRPWFGWGLRQVSQAHNAVLHHYQQSEPFTYAHSLILDLALGTGLPISVLIIAVVAFWAWRRLRSAGSALAWYGMALALPVLVHSMLEYPYSYVYFLLPALLGVGLLEARTAPNAVIRLRISYTILGALSIFLLMLWSAVEYVAIEEDFQMARFEALNVGQTPSQYERPHTHLLTQLDAMLVATRTVPAPGMSSADIELLRRAAMRFPWTAIQHRYALSLALNGNFEEATRQMLVMRAMHGEAHYQALKSNWRGLADTKFPQLKELKLP